LLASFAYLALRGMLQFIAFCCRSEGFKELEIVVLRHGATILRRQIRRPDLDQPTEHSWQLRAGSFRASAGVRSWSRWRRLGWERFHPEPY
jgi:hypothetical protein